MIYTIKKVQQLGDNLYYKLYRRTKMNKTELHALIAGEEPNICQIVIYKDGIEV